MASRKPRTPAVQPLGDVETVPIASLRPSEGNPRKIPERAVELVAMSLQRFGWQQPIVVTADGMIIAGHTRLLAAKSIGETEVPVVRADKLTPDQMLAYRIADNRTHDFTEWDYTALVAQLDELAEDYGDVLALADWAAVQEEYESSLDVVMPSGVVAESSSEFGLTVVFETREAADIAAMELIDRKDVLDVRHKRA